MIKKTLDLQVVRFGIIGLASNLVLYLLYFGITSIGVGYKLAMSLLYLIGVLQTFLFNKKWTFSHHGQLNSSFIRYTLIYGVAYLLNLGALVIFVERVGYPHQLVQATMIAIIALFLFVMQKMWVFRVKK